MMALIDPGSGKAGTGFGKQWETLAVAAKLGSNMREEDKTLRWSWEVSFCIVLWCCFFITKIRDRFATVCLHSANVDTTISRRINCQRG